MIRRMFWLVLGAVLGITGYRRLTRVAKALLPAGDLLSLSGRPAADGQRAMTGLVRPGFRRRTGAGTAAFVRDVRAGMADYMDRHRAI